MWGVRRDALAWLWPLQGCRKGERSEKHNSEPAQSTPLAWPHFSLSEGAFCFNPLLSVLTRTQVVGAGYCEVSPSPIVPFSFSALWD